MTDRIYGPLWDEGVNAWRRAGGNTPMKLIIQCAASKRLDAGRLRTRSGDQVLFVASPERCDSASLGVRHAVRPDNCCEQENTAWRDVLTRYNEEGENLWKLSRAADLYTPKSPFCSVYRELVDAFGWKNVFILSAGWGLIRAGFLTPDYDITFTAAVKEKRPWAWRDAKDRDWRDFNHLRDARIAEDEEMHFFGSVDYLPTLYRLLEHLPGKKFVHYKNQQLKPGSNMRRAGFDYEEYSGPEKNRTWYYRAAKDFAAEHGPGSAEKVS